MPRNRLLFTALVVLAIVGIGVFAIRSRGDNNDAKVHTTQSENCPPVARADAVATKPGTPISIDVLANDTDPDGDPLVFQIRHTTNGESTVDDGGTPTDASDDRVLFTPADPPSPEATIDYEALDPDGALSQSTVTVYVNDAGQLPADVRSVAVPTDANKEPGSTGCTSDGVTETSTTDLTTDSTDTTLSGESNTATTEKKSSSGGHTATTKKPKNTPTTKAPTTTEPHTSTTPKPATTTTAPHPTTTQTTAPDPCGPYPVNGSDQDKQDWQDCEIAHGKGG
jgi:hypothetical protein